MLRSTSERLRSSRGDPSSVAVVLIGTAAFVPNCIGTAGWLNTSLCFNAIFW